jgi:outer membrane lipoprotein carrier protein
MNKRMSKRTIRLLGLAMLAFSSALQAQTPLDSYLEHLKTLRTEFSQVVTDSKGRQVQNARGKLVIVRPGRFRWELTPSAGANSSPQLMVADGKNLWFYDRDLEQVSVKPASSAITATPAGLLSGEGNIRELFTVAPAGRKDGLDWVLVTPKEDDADFREARLAFSPGPRKDGDLKRMVLKDKLGQTVNLDFATSERNPPVAEAEVNFTPPPEADVIGTPAK